MHREVTTEISVYPQVYPILDSNSLGNLYKYESALIGSSLGCVVSYVNFIYKALNQRKVTHEDLLY